MRAWLVYDEEGKVRNADYIRMHQELGVSYDIAFQLVLAHTLTEASFSGSLERPDFAIVRTIQPSLSKKLEAFGIPVFNNSFVSEICNHKGKTMDYVSTWSDVPVIPTKTYQNTELREELLSRFPQHVIKAVDGHGGSQVFRTREDWEKIRQGIGTSDFVLQPFLNGPGKDLRLYVIGETIVGAVERTAADGFKANYSLGGQVRSYPWGEMEERLVREICRLFSFGMVGIDFLMDENGAWIFNEIEDVVGARMLYQCQPDCQLLERYFSFIQATLKCG